MKRGWAWPTPPLIDYLTDLLARFVRYDALLRLRNLSGQRLDEVAKMLVEAEARVGDARREVASPHRRLHAVLDRRVSRNAAPAPAAGSRTISSTYCAQGKRAYYIASTIRREPDDKAKCSNG